MYSNAVNAVGTTEQLRLGYDASNYWSDTISSDGGRAIAGFGADADLNFDFSGATDGDFSVNSDDLFVDTSTGNVGIGTTTPGSKLVLEGADGPDIELRRTGQSYWKLAHNNNSFAIQNDWDRLGYGDVVQISDGSGRSGYGPSLTIDANANAIFNENSRDQDFRIESDADTHAFFLEGSTGNIGIGTTNPSTFKLEVAGNIGPSADDSYNLGAAGRDFGCVYYNSGTLGTCASDERLKENIETLSFAEGVDNGALLKLARMELRTFEYKDAPGSQYHGLIAQEVEDFAPELVATGEDGFKVVKYGDIQWMVVEAIQEVWRKLEDIFTRVERLEERNQQLEERLRDLEAAQGMSAPSIANSEPDPQDNPEPAPEPKIENNLEDDTPPETTDEDPPSAEPDPFSEPPIPEPEPEKESELVPEGIEPEPVI